MHFAFLAIIVLGYIPEQVTSAVCSSESLMPPIFIAADSLFVLVYLIALILHLSGYCVQWGLIKQDDPLTEEQLNEQNLIKSKKRLFQKQSFRFIVYYTVLFILVLIQEAVVHTANMAEPNQVTCLPSG